ncbi:MAG: sensor histidine kinase [Acidobacteriota bacterium]
MCETLVARWEGEARRLLPALSALPRPALVETVRPLFLRAAAALADDAPRVPDEVAAHAARRTRAGIAAEIVAREYACMRDVLLDALLALAPPELVRDAVHALERVLEPWASFAIAACLREVELARERLVAILAHDLRTPLACIAMASEMLADSQARDPHAAGLQAQIIAATERMERMVSDMLDLARQQNAQELPVAPRPDDLGAICRSIVGELTIANPGRPIELSTSGDLRGLFDRDRVAQVLANLVRNAIEHGIGLVHVRVGEDADRSSLVLDVTNMRAASASGPLPALTRRSDGRLGLGLYIVHKIAAAHGATCTHDTTGVKTTYTITWPRAVASDAARPATGG